MYNTSRLINFPRRSLRTDRQTNKQTNKHPYSINNITREVTRGLFPLMRKKFRASPVHWHSCSYFPFSVIPFKLFYKPMLQPRYWNIVMFHFWINDTISVFLVILANSLQSLAATAGFLRLSINPYNYSSLVQNACYRHNDETLQ